MKVKFFYRIIALTLFFSLSAFFLSCDVGSDGNGDLFSDLLGTWYPSSVTGALNLITNSNQEAFDILGEGTGELSITGDYNADLQYLLHLTIEGIDITIITSEMIVDALNLDFAALLKTSAYPSYLLMIVTFEAETTVGLSVMEDEETVINYLGDINDFTITHGSYIVTANNAQFVSEDETSTLTVNGTLSAATIPVPANVPTEVIEFPFPLDPEQGEFVFFDDSTFWTSFELPMLGIEDTLNGTWLLDGNDLYLTADMDGEESTIIVEADVRGSNLYITIDEDPMDYLDLQGELGENEFTEEEILELLEQLFGLDPGSLDGIRITAELVLSRNMAKRTSTDAVEKFSYRNMQVKILKSLIDKVMSFKR